MRHIETNINNVQSPEERHASKSLFRKLVLHVSRLADNEIELVKAESQEKLAEVKRKTNLLVVAYLFLLVSLLCMIGSITLVLSTWITPWMSLLGFAILTLIISLCVLKKQLD